MPMTLADLVTDLDARGALTLSLVNNCKTSVKHLALALGYASAAVCPLDTAWQDEATWGAKLQAHFATLDPLLSLLTQRNTRSNIRLVMRLAAAHGLLAAPPGSGAGQAHQLSLLPTTRRDTFTRALRTAAPYQQAYRSRPSEGRFYGLQFADWPADIQAGWEQWRDLVRSRSRANSRASSRLRETTVKSYREHFALYLGFLTNIRHVSPTWETFFETRPLEDFIEWHAEKAGASPITNVGFFTVAKVAAMAKVLATAKGLKAQTALDLAALRNGLPAVPSVHKKEDHTLSLRELQTVANAYLTEGRAPYPDDGRVTFPGARRASRFQKGVMLSLFIILPMRQRNMRELEIGESLRQDRAGHWHIDFKGEGLKVAKRRGGINTYHVDLTDYRPEFIPLLDEWLQVYRPRLRNADRSRALFLTQYGNPFSGHALYMELADAVALKTGVRWFPHMIRSTWATWALEKTKDFTFVATMLGDTVQMVMKAYQQIDVNQQHAKAKVLLSEELHAG